MINSCSFFNFIFPKNTNTTIPVVEADKDLLEQLTENFNLDLINHKKETLKSYFQTHQAEVEKLNEFLRSIVKQGINQGNCSQLFSILGESIELETLIQFAEAKAKEEGLAFSPIKDLAQIGAKIYPQHLEVLAIDKVRLELRRYRSLILYFIPNLINIFLGAFNFLDFQKKSTSLWEKHLLLEIIYKFFLIPFALIQILNPILVVPAKVYCAAALIIVSVGSLVAAYQRWLRPFPDEIIKCENLDKKMQRGMIDHTVGRAAEISQLESALTTRANVLLIGKSGDGKTSLVHRYLQLKQEGKISKDIQDLHNFEMDCGALMGDGTYGFAEVLDHVKGSIPSNQMHQALMFFDKVEQIASNEACFLAFSKRFFEDQPSPIAIAATTLEGLKKIESVDKDGSFLRRFKFRINMAPASEEQNRAMLQAYIHQKANDLPIKEEEVINKIIECVKDSAYMPQVGTPSKVIAIMDNLIGRCRAAYNSNHSQELTDAEDAFNSFSDRMIGTIPLTIKNAEEYSRLSAHVEDAKKNWVQKKKKIDTVRNVLQQRLHFKNGYFKLTHEIAKTNPQQISSQAQKLYLLYHFYGSLAFEELITSQIAQIDSKTPIQINADLVETVFQELKRSKENAEQTNHGDSAR